MSSPPAPPSSDQHPPPVYPGDSKTNISTVAPEVQRTMSDFEHDQPTKETEWISGLKLWILMLPLCCTFFLIMLYISIIATVSKLPLASPNFC